MIRERAPLDDLFAANDFRRYVLQLVHHAVQVGEKVSIVLVQEQNSVFKGRAQHTGRRSANGLVQRSRKVNATDHPALGFNPDDLVARKLTQPVEQERLESLLRWLCKSRYGTEHRAPMTGNRLQVKDLGALRFERLQQACLATACRPRNDMEPQRRNQSLQARCDPLPIRFPAAGEHVDVEADRSKNVAPQARALAAAKAVNKDVIGRLVSGHNGFDVTCDASQCVGGANNIGAVRVATVQGADLGEFLLLDHRQIDRARHVIIRIFQRRSGVDDDAVLGQREDG